MFYDEIVNGRMQTSLQIQLKETIPSWMVLQYCSSSIRYYEKMSILANLLDIMDAYQIEPECICIRKQSREFAPEENTFLDGPEFREMSYSFLVENEINKDFKETFSRKERPSVYILRDNTWYPVYDYNFSSAVTLKSLQINSPALITILTGISLTCQIIHSLNQIELDGLEKELRKMKLEESKVDYVMKRAQLINKYNSTSVSDPARRYIAEQLGCLEDKQYQLNQTYGIASSHIDIIS